MADIKDYLKKLQSGTLSLEEQQLVLSKIEETIKVAKQKKDEAIGQKADMVVSALKQIESRLNQKYDELLQTPAMVGAQGPQGVAGKDGKDGRDGKDGINGVDGKDGADGVDGKDGISIVDVSVDFDGSLVVTLSDGNIIDAGQMFSPEVAQNIQIFKGGAGGTSLPSQTGNSGKYLTTDGSALSWGAVSGGGGSGDVVGPASATDNAVARFDATTGKLIQNSVVTVGDTGIVAGASISGASNTLTNIGNAALTNSAITINGTSTSLGGSISVGTVTSITAGTGLTGGTITSSGTIAIDSTVTTNSGTQTLTNKRITPRVSTTTSSATPTINTDDVDFYGLTAQAVDITSFTTNLSGTPTDGQKLWIYIVGTAARAIAWGASFEASTAALPTTTVSTNRLDVGFVWNAATSKWRCVAVA